MEIPRLEIKLSTLHFFENPIVQKKSSFLFFELWILYEYDNDDYIATSSTCAYERYCTTSPAVHVLRKTEINCKRNDYFTVYWTNIWLTIVSNYAGEGLKIYRLQGVLQYR